MLKQKLKNGRVALGSWLTLGHPAIAEIMAAAGFEWLAVDLEHSTLSLAQAGDLIRVIALAGAKPLVRLTSNNPDQIKRVLDAGAYGIIVPMVNSAEEAAAAVAATRYAPQGHRGVGLARAQGYGVRFQEYMKWQDEEGPMVIAQIEHIQAVNNLENILSVPGVDGYFIGPYDLSCSMGMAGDFTHPDFLNTLDVIRSVGCKMGSPAGIHVVEPDRKQLKTAIDAGYLFIAYSVDIRMLDVSARSAIQYIKEGD